MPQTPNSVTPSDLLKNEGKTAEELNLVLGLKQAAPPRELHNNAEEMQLNQTIKANRVIASRPKQQLDAIGISPDFYSSVSDWSSRGVVSIILKDTLYLWDARTATTEKLIDQEGMCSVKFSADGNYLSVGLEDGIVQLWSLDKGVEHNKILRKLRGHEQRVGTLAWNENVISSGSRDNQVHNSDVRVKDHLVSRWAQHEGEVCGLAWSNDGKYLASGANDNSVCIWELGYNQPKSIFREHMSAVKGLAWCPFQGDVLATGGGTTCGKIKLWNVAQNRCMHTVDTYMQVTSLVWGVTERELVSGHGPAGGMGRSKENQVTIWKYPSLTQISTLEAGGRVLGMNLSPDGTMIMSASDDELLRFWRIFPEHAKTKKAKVGGQRRMI